MRISRILLFFWIIGYGILGAKEPYNFVVFLVDDLGWADVSPNNPNTFYETPNIEKLANDGGIIFPQAYSTNPVCSPARYGIETSKYPTRGGITNWIGGGSNPKSKFYDAPTSKQMELDEITIAEKMKGLGYKTCIVGKWHLTTPPDKHGYDITISTIGSGKVSSNKYMPPFKDPRFANVGSDAYLPELLAKETANFIKENKNEKFFVMHSFYLVHTPLTSKGDLIEKYKAKSKRMGMDPEGEFEEINGRKSRFLSKQSNPTYAGMIESMDTAVGVIMNAIEDSNLKYKTVVIFTSDNGGLMRKATCNKPLRGGKRYTYEGGVRVPFIINIPDLKPDKEIAKEVVINTLDIYPTICELAGINIDHKIDGVSILPILRGDKKFKHPDIFWHYPHYMDEIGKPSGGIRSGDWKLIENYADGSIELYNIKDDIGENTDLASKYPEIVAELKKKLHVWYKDVDAKFLRPNPKFPNEKLWRPE